MRWKEVVCAPKCLSCAYFWKREIVERERERERERDCLANLFRNFLKSRALTSERNWLMDVFVCLMAPFSGVHFLSDFKADKLKWVYVRNQCEKEGSVLVSVCTPQVSVLMLGIKVGKAQILLIKSFGRLQRDQIWTRPARQSSGFIAILRRRKNRQVPDSRVNRANYFCQNVSFIKVFLVHKKF